MLGEGVKEMDKKCCCGENSEERRFKKKGRSEKDKKALISRINRISGQLSGIKGMIEEDRYCGDILIQISAAESALKSLSYVIMKNHLDTCVTDEILSGNTGITDEVMELFKKI